LDFISIEKTSDNNKITNTYGKSLPEDEIRSIMGRAIPPEWTVNSSALVKEPWRFKDLEEQLNMNHQQWQADQQKHIIAKMAGKMSGKTNKGKEKIMIESSQLKLRKQEHLKNVECFNCGKKGHYSTD
jgi:hypothetical protein